MKSHFVIATRGSALALWQANAVRDALSVAWPEVSAELLVVKTTGDATLDKPLHEIGDRALFTKELELALLEGTADMCVHSMKDVPTELAPGLEISAMLPRGDCRDALVCGPRLVGCDGLAALPAGARIGTGSLRREAQIKARHPQVRTLNIRGNVDTRLRKAQSDEYDGTILAAAGLARLGQLGQVAAFLDIDEMIPAAGQGAIGVETRSDDAETQELLDRIGDEQTRACVEAERAVLRELGGSCKVPVGVHVRFEGGYVLADAIVLSRDGSRCARTHVALAREDESAPGLVERVLRNLREQGADDILAVELQAGESL